MKFIPPKIHGYLDYAVILLLIFAPSLFGFTGEAAGISYVLAFLYLALVLLTAYPMGVFKAIPFTVHGTIELILSPILIALPWIAGFNYDNSSRLFFVIAGIVLFFVWLTTDYQAADIAYRRRGMEGTGTIRGAGA